jgi:hypothetical protein
VDGAIRETHPHAAEAQGGNFEAVFSQFALLHSKLLFLSRRRVAFQSEASRPGSMSRLTLELPLKFSLVLQGL